MSSLTNSGQSSPNVRSLEAPLSSITAALVATKFKASESLRESHSPVYLASPELEIIRCFLADELKH